MENRYKSKKQQKKFQEKTRKEFDKTPEIYAKRKKRVAKKYRIGYDEREVILEDKWKV